MLIFTLSILLSIQSHYTDSLELIKPFFESHSDELTNDLKKSQVDFYLLGKHYENIDIQKAIQAYTYCLDSAGNRGTRRAARVYTALAILNIRQGNQKRALSYLDSAQTIYIKNNIPSGLSSLHINKGSLYYTTGDFGKSLEEFLAALKIQDTLKDSAEISRIYNNIGSIYWSTDNLKEALIWHTKSYEINSKLNLKSALIKSLNNLGMVNRKLSNFKEAEAYYSEAVRLSDSLKLNNESVIANMGLVSIYIRKKEYDKAIATSKIATSKINESISNFDRATYDLMLGDLYYEISNYPKAITFFTSSYLNSDSLRLDDIKASSLEALSKSYAKQNDFKSAYNYLMKYNTVNDSLLSGEKNRLLLEMKTKFETNNKIKENELLQNNITIQKYELEAKRNQTIFLVVLVIIIALLTFFTLRFNKTKFQNRTLLLEQKLLRTQMNPHFIFNALITIESFIYESQPKQAGKYLSDFSRLMRLILESSAFETINLQKEMETLRFYLDLQKLRLEDTFDYSIELIGIDSPEDILIPPMLTQPFIENSVEHGFKKGFKKGLIQIEYKLLNKNTLHVTVMDNGNGIMLVEEEFNKSPEVKRPSAIQITKERLQLLNRSMKSKMTYSIEDLSKGNPIKKGTKVVFTIPI